MKMPYSQVAVHNLNVVRTSAEGGWTYTTDLGTVCRKQPFVFLWLRPKQRSNRFCARKLLLKSYKFSCECTHLFDYWMEDMGLCSILMMWELKSLHWSWCLAYLWRLTINVNVTVLIQHCHRPSLGCFYHRCEVLYRFYPSEYFKA